MLGKERQDLKTQLKDGEAYWSDGGKDRKQGDFIEKDTAMFTRLSFAVGQES